MLSLVGMSEDLGDGRVEVGYDDGTLRDQIQEVRNVVVIPDTVILENNIQNQ